MVFLPEKKIETTDLKLGMQIKLYPFLCSCQAQQNSKNGALANKPLEQQP